MVKASVRNVKRFCRYAHQRIDCCPFMESKTFCSNCSVHCYQKEQREQIRRVMRFSGPRMLLTERSWSFSICGCHQRGDIHETCLFLPCGIRIYAAGSRRCCSFCSAYDTVLLLSAWCFAKSSQAFTVIYSSTALYKNHLDSFRPAPLHDTWRTKLSLTGSCQYYAVICHVFYE